VTAATVPGGTAEPPANIDCDQHLFETPDLWAEYCEPADRRHALRLEEDDRGYTWLLWGSRRLTPAFHQVPGHPEQIGRQMQRLRSDERAELSYREMTPPEYEDPIARLRYLDERGIDGTFLFPNYGLGWERTMGSDLDATRANMAAWNRWSVEVAAAGKGRLHPVAHLTLRDLDWLDDQLAVLGTAGVRAGMIAPALVDGKRLSHPDLDRAWSAFVAHGVTPVFHVSDFPRPFDDAWVEDDPDQGNPVLSSVFLGTAPALALADLAIHGVFERHPDLRLGVIELSAVWVPLFLLTLDGGFDFHARFNGAPLTPLPLRPSEYIRRQVRIAAFAYEAPDRLLARAGDLFMFCSDYPHTEGTDDVFGDYRRMSPRAADAAMAPGLFGENARWLLDLR
jgi:predicted TIM-barrel fold metal-dependent hydrolase